MVPVWDWLLEYCQTGWPSCWRIIGEVVLLFSPGSSSTSFEKEKAPEDCRRSKVFGGYSGCFCWKSEDIDWKFSNFGMMG